jgi:hypothetical protein
MALGMRIAAVAIPAPCAKWHLALAVSQVQRPVKLHAFVHRAALFSRQENQEV